MTHQLFWETVYLATLRIGAEKGYGAKLASDTAKRYADVATVDWDDVWGPCSFIVNHENGALCVRQKGHTGKHSCLASDTP